MKLNVFVTFLLCITNVAASDKKTNIFTNSNKTSGKHEFATQKMQKNVEAKIKSLEYQLDDLKYKQNNLRYYNNKDSFGKKYNDYENQIREINDQIGNLKQNKLY